MSKTEKSLRRYFEDNRGRRIHKWLHYFDIYEEKFSSITSDAPVVLEIGVGYGGSLEMWRHYFGEKARIIGVDIGPACAHMREHGFEIFVGDQGDEEFWRAFKAQVPEFDLVIDDGGHLAEQQLVTFSCLFPHLKEGGLYICEDVQTGYRQPKRAHQKTFVQFAKDLVDDMHAWHDDGAIPNFYTRNIRAINFYNTMVVFEKRSQKIPENCVSGSIPEMPMEEIELRRTIQEYRAEKREMISRRKNLDQLRSRINELRVCMGDDRLGDNLDADPSYD